MVTIEAFSYQPMSMYVLSNAQPMVILPTEMPGGALAISYRSISSS